MVRGCEGDGNGMGCEGGVYTECGVLYNVVRFVTHVSRPCLLSTVSLQMMMFGVARLLLLCMGVAVQYRALASALGPGMLMHCGSTVECCAVGASVEEPRCAA